MLCPEATATASTGPADTPQAEEPITVTQLPEQAASAGNATMGADATGMPLMGGGLLGAAAQFARNATDRNMTGVSMAAVLLLQQWGWKLGSDMADAQWQQTASTCTMPM